MPLVVGTAGHVDHGKTSLVRALTGQDTDRLKEEKERGISIDLGFAWLETDAGTRVGIVDVPGHERFVRTMLAGVHGIDLVLFTVAADDGVMPQTVEHLDILHLLGVERGIFVITKSDLVDPARIAAVREEIEVLTAGTSLERAPVVAVSTLTGAGLDVLRAALVAQLRRPAARPSRGPFRLPIDRAFVIRGHGVVVTGTVVAGSVTAGDTLRLLPGAQTVRARGLEVHGTEVMCAGQGQRVAVNLAGVERAAIRRGDILCHPSIERVTTRFDAWVEIRPGAPRPLRHHGRVRVHLGAAEVLGKLAILSGATRVEPRGADWVQIMVETPVLALRGDRFILRDETARWTLGGGVVVNPLAERHRAGDPAVAEALAVLRAPDPGAAAAAFLELSAEFAVAPSTIAQALALGDDEVAPALAAIPTVLTVLPVADAEACTTARKWDRLRGIVLAEVAAEHRARPLATGVEMEHLRTRLPWDVPARTFRWCVDRLAAGGALVRSDSVVRLPTHAVALGDDARTLGERLERLVADGRFTPPDLRQLEEHLGVDRARLSAVLSVLEREGRAVRIAPDLWYAPAAAAAAVALVRTHCGTHGQITAAAFRDLIDASRKFAIAFLDWCDRTGVTIRVGDVRRLRR